MRVPLADVVQLTAKAAPGVNREALMKRGNPVEASPASLVVALWRCGESNVDMPPPTRTQKDAAGLVILGSDLPVPSGLTQHSRGNDDEPIVQRISEH
jgi:hypothetical protein